MVKWQWQSSNGKVAMAKWWGQSGNVNEKKIEVGLISVHPGLNSVQPGQALVQPGILRLDWFQSSLDKRLSNLESKFLKIHQKCSQSEKYSKTDLIYLNLIYNLNFGHWKNFQFLKFLCLRLDTRMSRLDKCLSRLDIKVSSLDKRLSNLGFLVASLMLSNSIKKN